MLRWPFLSLLVLALHGAFGICDCDSRTFVKFLSSTNSSADLVFVEHINNNGSFGEGEATDPGFPGNATNLPESCVVKFSIPSPDGLSSFDVGMFLPVDWNQRMIAMGNTGFGGGVSWKESGLVVPYGFATISTDTGHLSGPGDARWAQKPALTADWGYLAMHTSTVFAKQVISYYYGQNIAYSYFSACSGGGRQGLKEVQEYPEDFDGVIAGAAPWLLSHLHPWAVHVATPNLLAASVDQVADSQFGHFGVEVKRQCDPQDGTTDGIVSDPYGCNFNYTTLLCNHTFTNTSQCFSPGQLDVLKATYADWTDPNNNNSLIWPSYSLSASASLAESKNNGTPSSFGTEYVDNFIMNNTNWDWHQISPEVVTKADQLDPGLSNADKFDLSAFKTRGGKLLTYHGLSDPLIPVGSTIYYHERVQATMGGVGSADSVGDFFRTFLIPGMYHCSGGSSPWYIAGGGQSPPDNSSGWGVPGFEDAGHDVVRAMMAWVENGTAPDQLVATRWNNDDFLQGVEMQRPLCPYPKQAQFQSGNVSEASSWTCVDKDAVNFPEIPIASRVVQNGTSNSTTHHSAGSRLVSGYDATIFMTVCFLFLACLL